MKFTYILIQSKLQLIEILESLRFLKTVIAEYFDLALWIWNRHFICR